MSNTFCFVYFVFVGYKILKKVHLTLMGHLEY